MLPTNLFKDLDFDWGVVTLRAALVAVVILGVSWLCATLLRRSVRKARQRAGPSAGAALYVAERLSTYVVIAFGALIAVSTLGVNLMSLSVLAGAIGIGIGLGMQETVKNFIAGLSLLLDRSIEVGDFIELDEKVAGEVRSVGPRVTVVVTNDNVSILVPNSHLQQNRLTNWTRNHDTRRIHVPFRAAYGVDKDLVRSAAIEAARSVPFTLPDTDEHRTQVWLTGFQDSYLSFELIVWPNRDAVKRPGAMIAAYNWAIDDALHRHRIKRPMPQLDVRMLDGDDDDERLDSVHNDAAEDLEKSAAAEAEAKAAALEAAAAAAP